MAIGPFTVAAFYDRRRCSELRHCRRSQIAIEQNPNNGLVHPVAKSWFQDLDARAVPERFIPCPPLSRYKGNRGDTEERGSVEKQPHHAKRSRAIDDGSPQEVGRQLDQFIYK